MTFAPAKELGKKGTYRYTEIPCVDCGELHWVALTRGTPRSQRCHSCANKRKLLGIDMSMENNPNWRGGRHQQTDGYVTLTLSNTHPFYGMTDALNRVREHRLVLAEQLGRPLETNECGHHKNEVKSDNSGENLELSSPSEHCYIHHPILHPIENGKKKCTQCSKILPIERFRRITSRAGKQGHRANCKSCEIVYRKGGN